MSKKAMLLSFGLSVLTACGSDALIYNVLGNRVGSVTISEKTVFVKNEEGEIVVAMKSGILRDQFNTRMARTKGGVIEDLRGLRLGAVTEQGDCVDPEGHRLGKIAGNIEIDAKASACLMLLLSWE